MIPEDSSSAAMPDNAPSVDVAPSRNVGSVDGDNNNVSNITVNTNNGSINYIVNNTHVHFINDFMETDIQLVIAAIARNPAFIQLADEHNLLTEAILDETHFSGDPKNRNVFGSDKHGQYVNVLVNGKKGVIHKKVALARSVVNYNTIVNDPQVKPLLSEKVPEPSNISEFKRFNAERNRHDIVFYSKGNYQRPPTLKVPDNPPMYVTKVEIKSVFLRIMSTIDNPHHQDPTMYKELAMNAMTEYTFVANRWFKGHGEGWEVCKDETEIYKHVYFLLNDMKNSLRPEIKSIFSSPDDISRAHRILDYFPDRKIADNAVNWLKERE